MSRLFGWSYPPGCNGTPFDDDYPCELCGEFEDDCICPECKVCGSVGDYGCYLEHGLRRSEKQKFYLECNERQWKKEALDEFKYMKESAEKIKRKISYYRV